MTKKPKIMVVDNEIESSKCVMKSQSFIKNDQNESKLRLKKNRNVEIENSGKNSMPNSFRNVG